MIRRSVIVGAVAALSVVAGCGTVEDTSSTDEAGTAVQEEAESDDQESIYSNEPRSEPEPEEPEPAPELGTRENPLPLGETGQVGVDYEIAVINIDTDATEEVLAYDEFWNEPPAAGSTYVLVTLEGTFLGVSMAEGDPYFDLSAVIVGNDARQYADMDTDALAPNGLDELPTLEAGGTFDGNFVLELPEDALEDSVLFIESLFEFEETQIYWQMQP